VVPIDTATGTVGKRITYGHSSAFNQIVITPDGKTLYVFDHWGNIVVPITTATGIAGRPIKVARGTSLISVAPDGRFVIVGSDTYRGTPRPGVLTAISTTTNRRVWTDRVGYVPSGVAFGP
jgi:DNA-binding beta-propeller fold protein YncE